MKWAHGVNPEAAFPVLDRAGGRVPCLTETEY